MASFAPPLGGSRFAPGLLELAQCLDALAYPHVAALAAGLCRVESVAEDAAGGDASLVRGAADAAAPAWMRAVGAPAPPVPVAAFPRQVAARVAGGEGLTARADEEAVFGAANLFRNARLRLAALDCEPCALVSLAEALGAADEATSRRQALASVGVAADCERAAGALAADLAVPIGLAHAWLRGGRLAH